MSLYVRTQDKAKILEVSSISYEEKKKTTREVYENNTTSEVVEVKHKLLGDNKNLGEYISKDRCLEVMTEIQNTIVNGSSGNTIVYNMPEY